MAKASLSVTKTNIINSYNLKYCIAETTCHPLDRLISLLKIKNKSNYVNNSSRSSYIAVATDTSTCTLISNAYASF